VSERSDGKADVVEIIIASFDDSTPSSIIAILTDLPTTADDLQAAIITSSIDAELRHIDANLKPVAAIIAFHVEAYAIIAISVFIFVIAAVVSVIIIIVAVIYSAYRGYFIVEA